MKHSLNSPSQDLWYEDFYTKHYNELFSKPQEPESINEWYKTRNALLESLGEKLKNNELKLSEKPLMDFDKQRKDIDTIVIHHTGESTKNAKDPIPFLNAMHLTRLYIPQFLKKNSSYYRMPLWSNHFYNNQMSFVGYHWLVFQNGQTKQVLKDSYIGWHAGDWDVNTRSIGIAFVDDLEDASPTEVAINSAKSIIEDYKARYSIKRLVGHREISKSTICPGNRFLGDGGWKNLLS